MRRAALEKHIVEKRKKEAKDYLGKYYEEKNFRKHRVAFYRCHCDRCRNYQKRYDELHKIEDKEIMSE